MCTVEYIDPPPWPIYQSSRDHLITIARTLGPAAAGHTVPLTPEWSIAQVVAHVCGLNADVACGTRTGLGTAENTRRQVEERADRSVAEVCDEWISHERSMERFMADEPFFGHRLNADLVVHLHDVQHAIGESIDRESEPTRCAGHTYARRIPELVLEQTGRALRVELFDGTTFTTDDRDDDHNLTLRTSPYDFLRTVTGRRSRAEATALDWDGDPTDVIGALCPYGPLRDTDAGV